MSEQGTPFGNYLLLQRLARGGMAEVFLAQQQGLQGFDRRVALKRILPHLMDSEDFVRMFHDEAKLAARLSHPNVVHIYEFGQAEDHYFIAMEFVDGVHTGQLIEYGPTELIPPVLAARIGADACAGLNYAHRLEDNDGNPLQLVHRDISPPNLMISFDGVVKVVDFGIAKAVDMAGKTRPGIVKGKFAYMSPEQTMGRKLDGRSDVFSLGICIWEILAGRVALDRTDPVEAMKCIRDGRMPSILDVRPDVPRGLADVLDMALATKVAKRPTAAELGNAFESFIKSSPDLATSMQLSEWIKKRFKRKKTGAPRGSTPTPVPARQRTPAPAPTPAQQAEAQAAAMAFMQDAAATEEAAHIGGLPESQLPSLPRSNSAPAPMASGFRSPSEPRGEATPLPQTLTDTPGAQSLHGVHGVRGVRAQTPLRGGTVQVRQFSVSGYSDKGRRQRRILIGAIIGVVLMLGVILALTGGDESASSAGQGADAGAEATVSSSARDASAGASGETRDASVADAGEGETEDAGTEVTVVSYDAGAGEDVAWVVIKTDPDKATVSVDGSGAKKSPALFDDLGLGEHKVTIRRSGYRTVRQTFTLKPGMSELSYKLRRARKRKKRGKLNLFSRPACTAYIGKKKLGETPFAAKKLDVGSYTITCKRRGYKTAKKRVRIRANRTTKAKLTLKKR